MMSEEKFKDAKELADYWMKYNGPDSAQLNSEVWFAYRDSLRRMIDALLSRVDAEAVERMARLCESQPGHAWCAHAIRSTLPTPAARAGEENQ